jgi:anti-sigma regulatory factor (Ser/Thr protein kinase)
MNAIKYGYSETTIRVIGSIRPADYAVSVENFGIGVNPEEVLEAIP